LTQLAWVGVFAPKGTPKDVVEKINRGIAVATDSKKFQDWAASAGGGTAKPSTTDAQKMFESDRATWRDVVRLLGLGNK
jgi:tripartite-type tricarboxylate transporter receptor subunit TctC